MEFEQFRQDQREELLAFIYNELVAEDPEVTKTDFNVEAISEEQRKVYVRLDEGTHEVQYLNDPVEAIMHFIDEYYKPKTQLDLLDELEEEFNFVSVGRLTYLGYATYYREVSLILLHFKGADKMLCRFKSGTTVVNPTVSRSGLEPVNIVGVDE